MSRCQGCTKAGHGPADCENRSLPMCARTCTCRHSASESNPAPYWSAVNTAAAEGTDA